MTTTYYRTVDVSGIRFFPREAGPADAPVRLHGYFGHMGLVPRAWSHAGSGNQQTVRRTVARLGRPGRVLSDPLT